MSMFNVTVQYGRSGNVTAQVQADTLSELVRELEADTGFSADRIRVVDLATAPDADVRSGVQYMDTSE